MKELEIFQPECVKNFSCIGGECEDSCCKEWNIEIDKETYNKYIQIEDEEIKKIVKKKIKVVKKPTDFSYAIFKLEKNRKCPFWEEDGLCLLHKKLGADSLCTTCKEFPRSRKILNNTYNYTLSPACPEAARLILSNKEGLVFDRSLPTLLEDNVLNIESKNLFLIKDFTMKLLQYREINLEERLILLASIFDTINNDKDKIEDIVLQSQEMLKNKEFEINIDENMKSRPIQFNLYKEIHKSKNNKFTDSYDTYIKNIFNGLDIKNKEKSLEKYMDIKENKFNEFMSKYEYILENYLVNRVFLNEFPYSTKISMNDKCKELLIVYSLLKSNIIGLLSYNENPTEKDIISLIQSFTANIDHQNNLFSQYIKNPLLKVMMFDLYKQKGNTNVNSNDMAFELLNIALSNDEKLPFETVTEVIYFFI